MASKLRWPSARLPCALSSPFTARKINWGEHVFTRISLQKAMNGAKFNEVVERYMKEKKMTRAEAEEEYATFLMDSDGCTSLRAHPTVLEFTC